MVPNKICTLVVASAILATAGCSGAKLRNLISRNDYQSLEELEAADSSFNNSAEEAIAGSDKDRSRFVSDRNELEEEEEARDGRFSIARLLRRKPAAMETEFGEDPFVEPISTVVEKSAAGSNIEAVSGVQADRFQEALRTADRISASLDDAEKQAEDMFADAEQTGKAAGENAFAEAIAKTAAVDDSSNDSSQSFAEFMARNAARRADSSEPQTSKAVVTQEAAPKTAEIFARSSANTAKGGFDFDTLLEEPIAGANADAVADFGGSETEDSSTDSYLDQMFASAADVSDSSFDFDPPAADNEFDNGFTEVNADAIVQKSAVEEDPFSLASEKHGFKPLNTKDPWAAFENSTATTRDVAWGDETASVAKSESEFAWGQSNPTTDFDDVLNSDSFAANDRAFRQVASTSIVQEDASIRQASAPQSLVIPFSEPAASYGGDFAEMGSSGDLMDDPFFSAASGEELSEVPTDLETVTDGDAEASGNVGGPATILGWPTRTWFFILGCAILAILLFLPNRQKQHN